MFVSLQCQKEDDFFCGLGREKIFPSARGNFSWAEPKMRVRMATKKIINNNLLTL